MNQFASRVLMMLTCTASGGGYTYIRWHEIAGCGQGPIDSFEG